MSRKKKKQKKQQRETIKQTIVFELYGLLLLAVSLIAMVQTGRVGQALYRVFRFFAGSWDFLIPVGMIILSFYIMYKRRWPKRFTFRWMGIFLLCLSLLILSHLSLVEDLTAQGYFPEQSIIGATWNLYKQDLVAEAPLIALGGGMLGAFLFSILYFLVGAQGTKLIVIFLILISFLFIVGLSYRDLFLYLKKKITMLLAWTKSNVQQVSKMTQETKEETLDQASTVAEENMGSEHILPDQQHDQVDVLSSSDPKPEIHDFTEVAYSAGTNDKLSRADEQVLARKSVKNVEDSTPLISSEQVIAYTDSGDHYQLPPYSLLKKQERKSLAEKDNLTSNARKLERTLESFGVSAEVTKVHRGPAVTRYELYPDVGVKVSKIVSLVDDIALALAAKGIRIEAPIPGKSAIGIEVPNEEIAIVSLREVLESAAYQQADSKLTIALGRDISGEPIIAQLNKMPHLLVAGATGSGKSVCINGIIASILYKAKPHEVKFMMIDPKMVELNIYNGIPHLLTPVVTDPRKAANALKKVVSEMERRYELFAERGTRDIDRYNELTRKENEEQEGEPKPLLPYIVVIIDELADLMMVAPGDVEDAICRLAQMARAAGIHLIIATQRPSVDVITGLIKANVPSRIAFGVSSQIDSRTILDMGGAEKLLGRGDMLFLPVGASKALRVQGVFLTDEEVEQIVTYCIEQQQAEYHQELLPDELDEQQGSIEVEDDLFEEAVSLVRQQNTASVSMLQRRFRIGYNRAARLIDAMEAKGIVGPYEGSKPREVLISKEESNIS